MSYTHFNVSFPASHQYVAHVEINRPDKLNAFIEGMWLEMKTIFDDLSSSPEVRAIVLTGAGDRAFTAGLDVKAASEGLLGKDSLMGPDSDMARVAVKFRRTVAEFQECVSSIERCEKPVITVLHGITFGLGIDICSAADVRICTADVRCSVKEVDIGMAADAGTLTRLPKVVGAFGWVKEVALTAREFGAEESLRVGFVNAVHPSKVDAVNAALELAALMGRKSPVAVQGTKELLNWSRDRSVADGLRYTGVWNSAAVQTRDITNALLSSLQKRTPTFEKL
ncbi:hypothetical protein ASPZODRAFT_153868 [Penicilliopsis zonata CBS 506.65]|uniref:Enoyl-CoA hydratase n=1 Tax=Penicilliopsis zonata CBS 506.65 TaxID=1073090 RepID=A0A1L9SB78_9EURO|nr:hypothetical protein ASPZODRAFT_153868 [Penicilliopsis zonata CBS 506.65]OJJ44432.1 hypothetical protein ASPZODRAFT_153868 [Penicilliopsis zonata CBS 506.65]